MKTRKQNRYSAKKKDPTSAPPGFISTIQEIQRRVCKIAIGSSGRRLTPAGRRAHRAVGIVGAMLVAVLLNGCATIETSGNPDTSDYNSVTDYRETRSFP